MSQLKIYTFPDDVLAKKASAVDRVSKELYSFADDMLETMYFAPGIGLAANQVGVLKRFLVVDIDYTSTEDPEIEPSVVIENKKPLIIINPQVIYREGLQTFNEGCLSVPSFHAEVVRADRIRVQYQNIDGVTKVLSAEGLLAVVIQHEMDHLDGKLFIDRIEKKESRAIRKALRSKKE
jgi:peptide deformylase